MNTTFKINTISVVIATKDRPNQLKKCIITLLNSIEKPLEIIVVDQSTNSKTKRIISNIDNYLIKYFKLNSKGKSKSLNYAIGIAQGEILAFTDDDCYVSKKWIKNISTTFKKNKNISLCFGKTLPYKSKSHIGETCPCTFKKDPDIFGITDQIGKHWEDRFLVC